MKKILIFLIVGTLIIGGAGVLSKPIEKTSVKTSMIYFSEPLIKTKGEFVSVSFDETNSILLEQGKPILPSYIETYTFPFNTKIKSVTCIQTNIETIKITKDLEPTPKAQIIGQNVETDQKIIANYGTETYPSNPYSYDVGCGFYKGELGIIVKVAVYPIKYYPLEDTIKWAKDAKITIEYETPSQESTTREEYKLIIIAPDEYSDELAPLISHKIGRGVTTKFAGLTEVYDGSGVDNQEKIKYYIKDAIEEWGTSNVLLVGSNTKLPGRVTHVRIGNDDAEYFVSDLYYADIYDSNSDFCSWDSNGNGLFGEYNWSLNHDYDDVDLFPDVYLGRLACRTGQEVTTVVNKIMEYENDNAFLQNWFKNIVVIGGDTFPHDDPDEDVDEGEYCNQIVVDMMEGFTADKIWASNGKLTSWVPTGVQNIKDAIEAGCGFIDFSGHGNTNVYSTHPHLDYNTWIPPPTGGYTNTNVLTLSNGNMLPIVTVEACSTAKFASDDDCFNWAYIFNPNGGAIGTFGATGLGWGYTGQYVNEGIIGKIGLDTFRAYKLDDSLTYGEMWGKALSRYILDCSELQDLDYKTVEEWQPFGDPTLQIAPESGAPSKPAKPNGQTSGVPGNEYTYSSSTTDPENNEVYYMWDWGDGTFSDWFGPIASGAVVEAKHTWNTKDTYLVKVQAKDIHDKVSEWSDPLSINIPRNKILYNSWITELTQRFDTLLTIIQKLIQG